MHPHWLPYPGCSSPHGLTPQTLRALLKYVPRHLSSSMDRNDPACCSQPHTQSQPGTEWMLLTHSLPTGWAAESRREGGRVFPSELIFGELV